jgi:hypothetical protein
MTFPGIGVIIRLLSGDSSETLLDAAKGKTISAITVDPEYNHGDGGLVIDFADGTGIVLFDDGRSCCEERYVHTDDDLTGYVGALFNGCEIREAPNVQDDDEGVHEVQFLIVHTSLGDITVETHNEHNGYYGGFYLAAREK